MVEYTIICQHILNFNQMKTKEKILKAARQSFVQSGFSGSSMGSIAKTADVNHSLLFHHFGNKLSLWQAVKATIVQEANRKQCTLPSTDLPFQAFIKQLAYNLLSFYRDNTEMLKIISWQRLEMPESMRQASPFSDEANRWMKAFQAYQDKQELSPHMPINYAVSHFLGQISHIGIDGAPLLKTKKEKAAYTEFCIEQIYKTLKYS